MKYITTHSSAAINKKRKEIDKTLRKSGVRTLDQVLHTSVLSNEAKIKHIRHRYTCYDKFLKLFYKNEVGYTLRKELNIFLDELVKGKHTIKDLYIFNTQLKVKLKAIDEPIITLQKVANDNISAPKNIKKAKAIPNNEVIVIQAKDLKFYKDLSEEEQHIMAKFTLKTRANTSEKYREACCKAFLRKKKHEWMRNYADIANRVPENMDRYLVKLYLENRSTDFYKTDFSDLDYLTFKEIKKLAAKWLFEKFSQDEEHYETFMKKLLPNWVETTGYLQEDKLLEKLDV